MRREISFSFATRSKRSSLLVWCVPIRWIIHCGAPFRSVYFASLFTDLLEAHSSNWICRNRLLQTPSRLRFESRSMILVWASAYRDFHIQQSLDLGMVFCSWHGSGDYKLFRVTGSTYASIGVFPAVDPSIAVPLDLLAWKVYVAPSGCNFEGLVYQTFVSLSSSKQRVAPEQVTFTGLADAVRHAG